MSSSPNGTTAAVFEEAALPPHFLTQNSTPKEVLGAIIKSDLFQIASRTSTAIPSR